MSENGGLRRSSARLKRPVEEKKNKAVAEKQEEKEEENGGIPPESKSQEDDKSNDDKEEVTVDFAREELRKRWELASVLNFLGVFEPVIGDKLNMSAEEIEEGLIKPNDALAKLHVILLKGIHPVSKNLSVPDAWITALCKKLDPWWPWVAQGEIPLTASKGEEIAGYKELDPTTRLMMLKALCEVRMEEDDMISHINDAIKQGTEPSSFRKDRIGDGGSKTSYWYDGNMVIGYRLYREMYKLKSKSKGKGKSGIDPFVDNVEWETLATNLDEFRQVLDKFSSSKIGAEVAVCKIVETVAVPALENLQKKKERALKRQQRQEYLLNAERSYALSVRGSTRTRKPVSYTFDAYDHAIEEAIKMSTKRSFEERNGDMNGRRRGRRRNVGSNTDSDEDSEQSDVPGGDSMDEDENHREENAAKHLESNGNATKINGQMTDSTEDVDGNPEKGNNENDKKRMKSDSHGHTNDGNDADTSETSSLGTDNPSSSHHPVRDAKKLTRQRPTQNSATEDSDGSDSSYDQASSSDGSMEEGLSDDSDEE